MNKEIERIIDKYEINQLKDYLETVETVENIYIGVLGEFSSGKSSLLNSILGKKILPAMDIPTTKSITYVKSTPNQEKEIEYFEIKEDDSEEVISLIDFQDIAKGNRKGEAIVSVKKNDFLDKGYIFIDTPGVSSLDKTDTDITYGLLPKLDGILMCIDINTGTLSESIKTFLQSSEIQLIKDRILFILTRSDDKSRESTTNILEDFKKDISHYLEIDDVNNRILSFSSNEVLEKANLDEVANLENLFDASINERKKQMIGFRIKKQEELLKLKVIEALKDLKSKLSFNDEDVKAEKNKIETEIESLEKEKLKIKKKLDKFEDQLIDDIKAINATTKSKVAAECEKVTPDSTILQTVYEDYILKVNSTVGERVNRFFKDYQLEAPSDLPIDFSELSLSITSTIKRKEAITGLVTAAAIAAATAGASLAANAAETGAGVAAKQATQQATKEVAKKTIAKKAAAEVAKKAIVKKSTEEIAKITLKRQLANQALVFVSKLGEVAKEVNPIEHAGAYLAQKRIDSTVDFKISQIGRRICDYTVINTEGQIEIVFNNINEKLKINQDNLNAAFQRIKKGKNDVEKMKQDIQAELIQLG